MDQELERMLDELVDEVTTLAPNNEDDWSEIKVGLEQLALAGHALTVADAETYFRSAGMDQLDIPRLRKIVIRVFGEAAL